MYLHSTLQGLALNELLAPPTITHATTTQGRHIILREIGEGFCVFYWTISDGVWRFYQYRRYRTPERRAHALRKAKIEFAETVAIESAHHLEPEDRRTAVQEAKALARRTPKIR